MVGVDLGHLWGRSAETAGNVLETEEDDDGIRLTASRQTRAGQFGVKKTQRVDNIPLVSKQG